jgi:hypothetical protein
VAAGPTSTLRFVRAPLEKSGITLRKLGAGDRLPITARDQYGTYVTARVGTEPWRLHVADGIGHDDSLAFTVYCDEHAERRLAAAGRFIATFKNSSSPAIERVSRRTRGQAVHQAILQAIDGQRAGASQREIAGAVYGETRVVKGWTPDGELRARIRYFLRRGRSLMSGGYRRLVYL